MVFQEIVYSFAGIGALTTAAVSVAVIVDYKQKRDSSIARIHIDENGGHEGSSSGLSIDSLVKKAISDNVKGIIFDIHSEGGSVPLFFELSDYVAGLNIPKVAYTIHASSGAYLLASACDSIISPPYSEVGGIGVIHNYRYSPKSHQEEQGRVWDGVVAGENKDMYQRHRPLSDEERNHIQKIANSEHQQMINFIAEQRGFDIETIREVGEGLMYLGKDAIELGLVDHLGYFSKAVSILEESGGFKHKNIKHYRLNSRK